MMNNRIFLVFILSIFFNLTFSMRQKSESLIDETNQTVQETTEPKENVEAKLQRIKFLWNKRSSESAEKYFSWIRKTQRPVEYFRGKRFWLFTKKTDNDIRAHSKYINAETKAAAPLGQGLWRSGIVGRR